MTKRVLKRLLTPLGFEFRNGIYVRHINHQLHALNIQTHYQDMTINLYFHYDFLRSFRAGFPIAVRESKQIEDFEDLDFLFDARIGQFIDDRKDKWWSFDCDEEECKILIETQTLFAVQILDEYMKKWENPYHFLDVAKPEQIKRNIEEKPRYHNPVAFCYPCWYVAGSFLEFLQILAERKGETGLSQRYQELQELLKERDNKAE